MLADTLKSLDIAAIARDAAAHALAMHGDAPAFCRDFLVRDEAREAARLMALDATLDTLGVPAARLPFDYALDVVAPFVDAALASASTGRA